MKIRSVFFVAAVGVVFVAFSLSTKFRLFPWTVVDAGKSPQVSETQGASLPDLGLIAGDEVFLRIFKEESELEV
ncbi:MAG: hypothetical protein AAGJ79_12280 [Verrucomicrobiota bacterium]